MYEWVFEIRFGDATEFRIKQEFSISNRKMCLWVCRKLPSWHQKMEIYVSLIWIMSLLPFATSLCWLKLLKVSNRFITNRFLSCFLKSFLRNLDLRYHLHSQFPQKENQTHENKYHWYRRQLLSYVEMENFCFSMTKLFRKTFYH